MILVFIQAFMLPRFTTQGSTKSRPSSASWPYSSPRPSSWHIHLRNRGFRDLNKTLSSLCSEPCQVLKDIIVFGWNGEILKDFNELTIVYFEATTTAEPALRHHLSRREGPSFAPRPKDIQDSPFSSQLLALGPCLPIINPRQ